MNFETLKSNFRKYLEDNTKPWNKTKLNDIKDDNTSIFMYADEFKEYLVKELNCDTSLLFKGIDEIMKYQMVDGKLVDPDEVDKDDAAAMAELENAQSLGEAQVASEKPVQEGEVSEEGEISEEGVQGYDDESGIDIENPELLADILNDLIKDENFKGMLDTTEDGEIDDEELKIFLSAIKDYDKDGTTISLEDILGAVADIKSGIFDMKISEEIEKEANKETKASNETENASNASSSNAKTSGGAQSGGSVGRTGGGFYGANSSPVAEKLKYDENGNAILANMDLEDLKKELADSQAKVSEQQAAVDAAKSEKETGLGELEKDAQEAYDKFTESLDEKTKEEIDNAKQNVDAKQEALDSCNDEIASTQEEYNSLNATVSNLTSSKSAYESQKNALSTSLSNAKGDEKTEVQSKIDAIQKQIDEIENKLTEAKNQLEAAKAKLEELNAQKAELEQELQEAQAELNSIEDKVVENNPQLEQLREAYDTAKEKIATERTNYDKAIENAQAELKTAQEHVRDVESAISAAETSKNIKDNYSSDDNKEIVEFAKSLIGCNEADGSADKFLGGSSSANTPWCAAFVSYVLQNNGVNTGGIWSVSGLLDWGKQNNNFISKANSSSDNVKPGDVVIWKEGGKSHSGIVTSIDSNGNYTTVEGNTSNKVAERQHNINTDKSLTGFISIKS